MTSSQPVKVTRADRSRALRKALKDSTVRAKMTAGQRRAVAALEDATKSARAS